MAQQAEMHPFYTKIPLAIYEERNYVALSMIPLEASGYNDYSVIVPFGYVSLVLATIGYGILIFTLIRGRAEFSSFFHRFLIFDSIMEWSVCLISIFRISSNRNTYLCSGGFICPKGVCGYRKCDNWFWAFVQGHIFGWVPAFLGAATWSSIFIGIDRTLSIYFPIWYRTRKPFQSVIGRVILLLFFFSLFAFHLPFGFMYFSMRKYRKATLP